MSQRIAPSAYRRPPGVRLVPRVVIITFVERRGEGGMPVWDSCLVYKRLESMHVLINLTITRLELAYHHSTLYHH
jgi:hypothetical protein